MSVLLLGNGVNQLEGLAPGWDGLLKQIAAKHGCKSDASLSNILGYEMLEQQILRNDPKATVRSVRQSIADGVQTKALLEKRDWSGSVHAKLTALPVNTILTTNYDYALERSLDAGFQPVRFSTETTYSLRRFHDAGGKRVFHVHGECEKPNSICLGYEHYAGTLQKIREQIVLSTGKTMPGKGYSFQLADVLHGLTEKPADSWIYDFFLEDVYILGLSLDVSELDLWWLLSYRSKQRTAGRLPIENRVVFLDTGCDEVKDERPDCARSDCGYRKRALNARREERQRKRALLDSFGVEYVMCAGDSFPAQYDDALRRLKKLCGRTAR